MGGRLATVGYGWIGLIIVGWDILTAQNSLYSHLVGSIILRKIV